MVQSKLGLKALGLCALVVGIMAFVTSGVAQAETGASWGYKKTEGGTLEKFTTALLPELNAKLDTATASLEFTTAGGTNVAITCTAGQLIGSPKLLENGSISEGQAKFSGCEVFLNGVLSKNCEAKTSGGAAGEIVTNKATGLIKLHLLSVNGPVDPTVLLTPTVKNKAGLTVATIIQMGPFCSVAEEVEVTGDLTLIDCKNEFTVHKVEHLVEEFSKLRGLTALGRPATIVGSAFAFLEGTHKGYFWAGLPSSTKP